MDLELFELLYKCLLRGIWAEHSIRGAKCISLSPLTSRSCDFLELENPAPRGYTLEEAAFLLSIFVFGRGKVHFCEQDASEMKTDQNRGWEHTGEENKNNKPPSQLKKGKSVRSCCPPMNALG